MLTDLSSEIEAERSTCHWCLLRLDVTLLLLMMTSRRFRSLDRCCCRFGAVLHVVVVLMPDIRD